MMDPENAAEAVSEASTDGPVEEMTLTEAFDTISAKGNGLWLLIAVLSLSSLSFAAGFWSNLLLYVMGCMQQDFDVEPQDIAMVTSAAHCGTLVGASLLFPLADVYGRKILMTWCPCGVLVFTGIYACSPSLMVLAACRVAVGFFMGAPCGIAVDYVIEVAPTQLRGRAITCLAIAAMIGRLACNVSAGFILPSLGWRALVAASTFPFAIAILMMSTMLVESPRFLLVKGRDEEALEAMAYIASVNGTTMPCRKLVKVVDETTPLSGEQGVTGLLGGYQMLLKKTEWSFLLLLCLLAFVSSFSTASTWFFQGLIQGRKKHSTLGQCQFDYTFQNFTAMADLLGSVAAFPLIDNHDLRVGGRKGIQMAGYLIAGAAVALGACKAQPKLGIACIARTSIAGASAVTEAHGRELLGLSTRGTGTGVLTATHMFGSLTAPCWVLSGLSTSVIASGIAAALLFEVLLVSRTPETALVECNSDKSWGSDLSDAGLNRAKDSDSWKPSKEPASADVEANKAE